MSSLYTRGQKLAIAGFLALFAGFAAAQELEPIEPNIIDYKIILVQHYAKKGYSVLLDTLTDDSYSNRKWVVIGDVVVPPGKKLIVPPGVNVFFEPNTSIKVNGELAAPATPQSPVVFTRIDSSKMLKKPPSNDFTWEGINVGPSGKLHLEHVEVVHARSGIISNGPCDSLVIDSVMFRSTAPFTLGTADFSLPVRSDTLFSLQCPSAVVETKRPKPPFLYWMYALGGAGAVSSGVLCAAAYRNDHEAAEIRDHFEAQPLADKTTRQYKACMWTGIASAAILAPALVIQISTRDGKETE